MKRAFVFPGQGAQFEGMGKDLFENNTQCKDLFLHADAILGFSLSAIMFNGNAEELKQTKVTQPALFVHGLAKWTSMDEKVIPHAVAGHSLGEFTALVASGALSFEDGLTLVAARANAMQEACEANPGTMAAILGLDDSVVEEICLAVQNDIVVAANYNCPGQLVISGTLSGVNSAIEKLKEAGAKRALLLPVGGAFHSPLMKPAQEELEEAISNTDFNDPICPIYQNVNALPSSNPLHIKANLISQLTGAVKWTQSVQNMFADGIIRFTECGGTGKILGSLIKKICPDAETDSL